MGLLRGRRAARGPLVWRSSKRRAKRSGVAEAVLLRLLVLLPEAQAADDGVAVVAGLGVRRQAQQLLGVAAAQHDVVHDKCRLEARDHILDEALPLLATQPPQPALAEVVLVGALFAVGKV